MCGVRRHRVGCGAARNITRDRPARWAEGAASAEFGGESGSAHRSKGCTVAGLVLHYGGTAAEYAWTAEACPAMPGRVLGHC